MSEAQAFPEIMGIKIRRMKIEDLNPHERNPRIHPDPGTPEWDTLVASLAHDYFDPLVWNVRNNKLVSGHLRRKVMMAKGVKEVDVVEVDYDESTHLARLFAANKSIGVDDEAARKSIFMELHSLEGFDTSLAGYTFNEFSAITFDEDINNDELTGREDQPENPRDSAKLNMLISTCQQPAIVVESGDEWALGDHRLFCCSILRGEDFAHRLIEMRAQYQGTETTVLFVPCPDPYVPINADPNVVMLLVQPDAFVASHLVTNFIRTYPDRSATKQ